MQYNIYLLQNAYINDVSNMIVNEINNTLTTNYFNILFLDKIF